MRSAMEASELRELIEELRSFGNRWIGSPGERKAREFIRGKLEEIDGLEVRLEKFSCPKYAPRYSRLTVLHPVEAEIPCEPLEYSGNGYVEGEVIYVGGAEDERLAELEKAGCEFENKIALVVSDTPAFRIPALLERGVSGIIVGSDAPENLIRALAAKTYPPSLRDPLSWKIDIPAVAISRPSVDRLLSLRSAGSLEVKLEHEGSYSLEETMNVLGILEGRKSEEMVIIGAHYDSQIKGVGVWDNLTGVAVMLKLAEKLSLERPRKTMVFAAFAAEEIGLWGSTVYVENHRKVLDDMCAIMFCLDAVSSAFPAERSLWSEGRLRDFIIQEAEAIGMPIENTHPLDLSFSDYYPFAKAGVPSAMIWENPPTNPYYHTEKDDMRYIDFEKLASMGRLYLEIIRRAMERKNRDFR